MPGRIRHKFTSGGLRIRKNSYGRNPHRTSYMSCPQMSLVVLNGFSFMIMINLSSDLIGVGFDLFIPFFTPDVSGLKLNSNYQ